MAEITLGGNPCKTKGELPKVGGKANAFEMRDADLESRSLSDYTGSKLVLNVFPSVDTGVCATSIRKFNEMASGLENTKVLCISKDLPFAQKRFCGAEGIENVEMLSDFESGSFGDDYELTITIGKFKGLHSRVIIVLNENHEVVYTEQVPEIGQEPNYDDALKAL